ncbi:hypothetical protein J0J30_24015, partial [Vibrio vulnificus]|nr:hypothetical protein [Vibrio vulnificus]
MNSKKEMEAMDMPIKYRLLHYAINRHIFPKKATNNHITNLDIEILWHLKEGREINFPHLMLHMMKRKRKLLYA